jgi:hypothetical protein
VGLLVLTLGQQDVRHYFCAAGCTNIARQFMAQRRGGSRNEDRHKRAHWRHSGYLLTGQHRSKTKSWLVACCSPTHDVTTGKGCLCLLIDMARKPRVGETSSLMKMSEPVAVQCVKVPRDAEVKSAPLNVGVSLDKNQKMCVLDGKKKRRPPPHHFLHHSACVVSLSAQSIVITAR